jgi:hypothetical protein
MNNDARPFAMLPGFRETIAALALVPSQAQAEKLHLSFLYPVRDEKNKITYTLVSARVLSPGDIRRALARAFSRTDSLPNDEGNVEIIV